jgi:hypothetical protein
MNSNKKQDNVLKMLHCQNAVCLVSKIQSRSFRNVENASLQLCFLEMRKEYVEENFKTHWHIEGFIKLQC